MSTSAPFAAIQAGINAGVGQLLANAIATWQGGEPFAVIFERAPMAVLGEVMGAGPRLSVDAALLPGVAQGSVISIDGTDFEIVGAIEPDESGWLNDLALREA
ncbi:MAG: hypothetical protein KIS62_01275 [Ramlibacter sp.]|nr:hypothetical protein [Ramlibacter sp.]